MKEKEDCETCTKIRETLKGYYNKFRKFNRTPKKKRSDLDPRVRKDQR